MFSFFVVVHLWQSAPPEEHLRRGSLRVIGLGYLRLGKISLDLEWGYGGLWKGIPLEPSFSRTHLSARDTASLPGPALSVALESGVSKEVHSSPGSKWSHNTQPTGVLLESILCLLVKAQGVMICMQYLCSPSLSSNFSIGWIWLILKLKPDMTPNGENKWLSDHYTSRSADLTHTYCTSPTHLPNKHMSLHIWQEIKVSSQPVAHWVGHWWATISASCVSTCKNKYLLPQYPSLWMAVGCFWPGRLSAGYCFFQLKHSRRFFIVAK